jgi:E3 ubiquitin-protein ligase TRIP12
LEGLLDVPTVVAVNSLLMPSGGSPLLSPGTYTHLLKALTTSARGSAKVAVAFLEAGMTNTIHQILTGVLPSSHEEDEQGGAEGGQGLSGGVADMAVLQNLAHRPKDQVEEALALICELLPPTPRDGVFDSKAYSEKSLHKLKKGRRSDKTDKTPRRSIRNEATGTPASTSANTPAEATIALPPTTAPAAPAAPAAPTAETTATAMRDSLLKAKKEADAQVEQRVNLFKAQPELVAKFIKAMVPVLVDVYAASVAARVRTKVLSGLTKAIAFAERDILLSALKVS